MSNRTEDNHNTLTPETENQNQELDFEIVSCKPSEKKLLAEKIISKLKEKFKISVPEGFVEQVEFDIDIIKSGNPWATEQDIFDSIAKDFKKGSVSETENRVSGVILLQPYNELETRKEPEKEPLEKTMPKADSNTLTVETQEAIEKPVSQTSSDSCNTITPNSEKFSKLYQWCIRLTTEQGEENYGWTLETQQLAKRLESTTGNLIAVIGLQGTGKTALKQALWGQLLNVNKRVLCFKWKVLSPDVLDLEIEPFYLELILTRLLTVYDEFKLSRKLGISTEQIKAFQKGEIEDSERKQFYPLILKHATKEERKEIERSAWLDAVQTKDTILIDFPDYSRENQSKMNRDLDDFSHWWESIILADSDGIYRQKANVVIFFQKELFSGHFLFGKFDVFELNPINPKLMVDILRVNCGSIEPFLPETLEYIAELSRGVIRRFKKYVKLCLESLQHGCNSITVELAKNLISLEQLEKDMELELMDVFPKQKELRRLSVILLQLLRDKGSTPQSEITETIFDNNKMKCSRVLEKLEAWNYIEREWTSMETAHQKVVKLKEVS